MNDADLALIDDPSIQEVAFGCALECSQAPPDQPCDSGGCVAEQTGLTPACAQCVADLFACIASACLQVCFQPESPECSQCVVASCGEGYLECSGIDLADAQPQ